MATKQFKACLFDMDGLLLATEHVYTETVNEILARYGKGPMPMAVKKNMMGRIGVAAAQVLIDWAELPLTPEEYFKEQSAAQAAKWQHVKPMPGAVELVTSLTTGGVPISVATSSARATYELKTASHGGMFSLFGNAVVTGDDSRIPPGRGKPDPDIFLVALNQLNELNGTDIKPHETIVFEDSLPGVRAGINAGMEVVWVPDPLIWNVLAKHEQEEILGHGEVLESLAHFDLVKVGLQRE